MPYLGEARGGEGRGGDRESAHFFHARRHEVHPLPRLQEGLQDLGGLKCVPGIDFRT